MYAGRICPNKLHGCGVVPSLASSYVVTSARPYGELSPALQVGRIGPSGRSRCAHRGTP